MQKIKQVNVQAGDKLKIVVKDNKGNYVTQFQIVVPEDVVMLGKVDINMFYFGEVTKAIDCS